MVQSSPGRELATWAKCNLPLRFLDDTRDTRDNSANTPPFKSSGWTCFQFKYKLFAVQWPVALTIWSSRDGILFQQNSTALPSEWLDEQVTVSAGCDQVVTMAAKKMNMDESVLVADFVANEGQCYLQNSTFKLIKFASTIDVNQSNYRTDNLIMRMKRLRNERLTVYDGACYLTD